MSDFTQMHPPYRLHAPILAPSDADRATWHPDGVLAVDERGRILFAGAAESLPVELRALPERRSDHLVMPAFIDAHVHLPQYDCRGRHADSLMRWLNDFIYPEEIRFAEEAVARDTARRFFHALAEAGTGTAMVYGSVHERATDIAFEEAEASGLRIILGKVQMDRGVPPALCENTTQSLRSTEALINRWHRRSPLLHYAVTPRFAPVCTEALLAGCGALAEKYGTHVQTHLNESLDEIALVRTLFPRHASYTDVYADTGLLGEKTMLGHNIHPTDDELRLCARHRCAVAHCPDSNLFLGSGRFPRERYAGTGIRIALGSDVGAGSSLSMFRIMRAMSHVQSRALPPAEVLHTATRGGALALGFADETGALQPGLSADFIELSTQALAAPSALLAQLSADDMASLIVHRGSAADVRALHVAGVQVN